MPRQPKPFRKTVVRWKLPQSGKQVKKGTPGAIPVRTKTESYYFKHRGKLHPLKTTDKGEAWVRMRAELARLAEERAGRGDPTRAHAGTALERHRLDWLAAVRDGGATPGHLETLADRTAAVCAAAGWKTAPDMNEAGASTAVAVVAKARDWSAQTRKHAVRHLKQFGRWLVRSRRLASDPFLGLAVPRATEKRHARRTPTDEEVGKLFGWLEGGGDVKVRCGVTGSGRALLYRVAMSTGFRAGECRSLTPASIDPKRDVIHLGATADKRRRGAEQPVPPWLAAELRAWLAAGGQLWTHLRKEQPGRFLRRDLRLAGVEYVLPGPGGTPLYFDFHSLRRWYVGWAAHQPGISPKVLQELARHSDPRLTLSTYAEGRPSETAQAVGGMPRPGGVVHSGVSAVESVPPPKSDPLAAEVERLRGIIRAAGLDPDAEKPT